MLRIGSIFSLIMWLLMGSLHAQVVTLLPKLWQGEALQKDEGLFYLQGSVIDADGQHRGGSFSYILYGKNQQKAYSLQFDLLTLGQHPDKVWKLKEDDYQIAQIQHIDSVGKRWTWVGPYRSKLLVKSRSLSNFGIWYLVQLRQSGRLGFLIKNSKNVFNSAKTQGSIARVIDGLSGQEQAVFEPKAAAKQGELRATYRFSRSIAMYYKLNLFRQNQSAPLLIAVIESKDADIRSCYTDFLERGTVDQGLVRYTMVLSNQTQSIKTLKVRQADIKDERFMECLYYKLMALSFPVKESMIGELTLTFKIVGT